MKQTRRETVLRAIEHRGPERLPIKYCNRDLEDSDVLFIGYNQAADFTPTAPGLTEWGYTWHSFDGTMGQPEGYPLQDEEAIESYTPPDANTPERLCHWEDLFRGNPDRFIVAGLGITGFNQATFLRGFEPFLTDLYVDRDRANRILDLVFGFENAMIDRYCRYPIDGVGFADDWGTQEGLMISPELWREVFKPRYAEQFARIRQAGKKVWFHSCGKVDVLFDDLIEIGVDVLELLQPDVFGVEELARACGGRVTLCCSIDHQRLAISGTREEIHDYALRLHEQLGRFHGGFIAYIEDYSCMAMPECNYQWIRQAFHGLTPLTAGR